MATVAIDLQQSAHREGVAPSGCVESWQDYGRVAVTVVGRLFIGTAGWNLPRAAGDGDVRRATRLERYGRRLDCVEINSSFYRFHQYRTYVRWAESTPPDFCFSLKLPRTITHHARLGGPPDDLDRFLGESAGLGEKRGPVLIQLPPSLPLEPAVANRFFALVRQRHTGSLVCEPRHPTWFTRTADRLLAFHQVARVAADPPRVAGGDRPGGWTGLAYFRWHGSPRTYWSAYSDDSLETIAHQLQSTPVDGDRWCIFDNTALGHALENAEALKTMV
jgi:uncharacterized protein YecE (DUF72 family)